MTLRREQLRRAADRMHSTVPRWARGELKRRLYQRERRRVPLDPGRVGRSGPQRPRPVHLMGAGPLPPLPFPVPAVTDIGHRRPNRPDLCLLGPGTLDMALDAMERCEQAAVPTVCMAGSLEQVHSETAGCSGALLVTTSALAQEASHVLPTERIGVVPTVIRVPPHHLLATRRRRTGPGRLLVVAGDDPQDQLPRSLPDGIEVRALGPAVDQADLEEEAAGALAVVAPRVATTPVSTVALLAAYGVPVIGSTDHTLPTAGLVAAGALPVSSPTTSPVRSGSSRTILHSRTRPACDASGTAATTTRSSRCCGRP